MTRALLISAAIVGSLVWFGLSGTPTMAPSGTPSKSESTPPKAKQADNTETTTKTTAADAAQVGDVVTLIYSSSTIMCAERNDMSKVYVSGEVALRQTWRMENSALKAVQAKAASQKSAMANAYSANGHRKSSSPCNKRKSLATKNHSSTLRTTA